MVNPMVMVEIVPHKEPLNPEPQFSREKFGEPTICAISVRRIVDMAPVCEGVVRVVWERGQGTVTQYILADGVTELVEDINNAQR